MFKKTIAAIILVGACAPALAQTSPAPDLTREHRIWAAEQMVNRLTIKFSRSYAACNQIRIQVALPTLSEACKTAVLSAYPVLATIREIATKGTEVQWIDIVYKMHTLEDEID